MFGLFKKRDPAAHDWTSPLGNTVLAGDTGAAKTTGVGAHALAFVLTHPDRPAVLFTSAKPSDPARYERLLQWHGHAGYKVIRVGGRHGLDPVRTYLRHPAASYWGCERLLAAAVRLADDGSTRGGDEEFWARSTSELRLAAVTLTHLAYRTCDVRGVDAFIRACPYGDDHKATDGYKQGFAFTAMKAAEQRATRGELTAAQMRQLEDAIRHVNVTFCRTEAKCRESIRLSAVTGLGTLLAEPVGSLLDLDTVSPDDLQNGVSIVNAVGVIEHKAPGRLFAALLRMVCDEWLVARDPATARPVVSWQDEAHLTLVPEDVRIATVCRESKLHQYRLLQTLPVAHDAVKGAHPEHLVAALFANHPYKVFHNTRCPVTAKAASDYCGERIEVRYGGSVSPDSYDPYADLIGSHRAAANVSWSEHWVPALRPSVLGTLRRGGAADGFVADAVVIEAGRPWRQQTFRQIFA